MKELIGLLRDEWRIVLLYVATLAALVAIWYGASYLEARSYNRITGSNVSAVDAMFVQLRVQEGSK